MNYLQYLWSGRREIAEALLCDEDFDDAISPEFWEHVHGPARNAWRRLRIRVDQRNTSTGHRCHPHRPESKYAPAPGVNAHGVLHRHAVSPLQFKHRRRHW